MVKKIFFRIKKASILFVDDNSIDGTRDIILSLKKKNKRIFYVFRKNRDGIGSAHKIGFLWAKKKNLIYALL